MNVMVVGSGGREHAICDAFRRSDRVSRIVCAPGNPGIAQIADCIAIKPEQVLELADYAETNGIDLTFVGGETALSLGIVDEFASRGLRIIGPTQKAAQLESSKAFAKDFMARHSVPTADFEVCTSVADAIHSLQSGRFGDADEPVVVKADGLAAGKGVVVAPNKSEAIDAVQSLESLVGTEAAKKIVIEECLIGKEVSLLMFASGEEFVLMPPTRDHKRIGEGDTGPNTGGMGTVTDASLLSAAELDAVIGQIIAPTLRGCVVESLPFRGVLFLGLMMTATGAKLLEYNVRFGDPETQAILVRLDSDLAEICDAIADGTVGGLDVRWKGGSSACVVLAAEGYPAKPRIGDEIHGLAVAAELPNVSVFQAGTAESSRGRLMTGGGRVLGVTAVGPDLRGAIEKAYDAAQHISFAGMHYRRDIGADLIR